MKTSKGNAVTVHEPHFKNGKTISWRCEIMLGVEGEKVQGQVLHNGFLVYLSGCMYVYSCIYMYVHVYQQHMVFSVHSFYQKCASIEP